MLKIENRGYHGNGGADPTNICIFVQHSAEVKTGKASGKSFFFFFFFFLFPDHNGECLMVTGNDS